MAKHKKIFARLALVLCAILLVAVCPRGGADFWQNLFLTDSYSNLGTKIELKIDEGFAGDQFVIVGNDLYKYNQKTSHTNATFTKQNNELSLSEKSSFQLIFLKQGAYQLSTSVVENNIASIITVSKPKQVVYLTMQYAEGTAYGIASENAEYVLGEMAVNTTSQISYINGEFVIGESKKATGLMATTSAEAKIMHLSGGVFSLRGDMNYKLASGKTGRAFYVESGTLNLEGITLDGFNNAGNGGAVYLANGEVNIGCTIKNCSATNGGAIAAANGTVNICGGTYSTNSATGNGGAIFLAGSATLNIQENSIVGTWLFNEEITSALFEITTAEELEYYMNLGEEEGAELPSYDLSFVYSGVECESIISMLVDAKLLFYEDAGSRIYIDYDNVMMMGGTPVGSDTEEQVYTNGHMLVYVETNGEISILEEQVVDNEWTGDRVIEILEDSADPTLRAWLMTNATKQTTDTGDEVVSVQSATFSGNTAENGGAIYVGANAVFPTLSTGIFSENGADYGGVIASEAELTIAGGFYTGNSALMGGVVACTQDLTISNGIFEENEAGNAGVIYPLANLTISGGNFVNNTATENGGVVVAFANKETIIYNGTFTGNSAVYGGVVYGEAESLIGIVDGRFVQNTATVGGVICGISECLIGIVDGSFTQNSATSGGVIAAANSRVGVNGGSFSSNVASSAGGVIACEGGELLVEGATFSENSATEYGGAIACSGTTSATIASGSFVDNIANAGGAVYALQCDVVVESGNFECNSATNGGAICTEGDSSNEIAANITIQNGSFINNTAIENGGVAYAMIGSVEILDGSFTLNNAHGAGVAAALVGEIKIKNGTFDKNSATTGGVVVVAIGYLTIENGTFTENSATTGGVAVVGLGNIVVTNGTFDTNTANDGGVFSIAGDTGIGISGGTFTNNIALNNGGVIGADGEEFMSVGITGGTFNANEAKVNGGVVYFSTSRGSTFEISGGSFNTNSAANGGVIYVSGQDSASPLTVEIEAGTFTENTATENGGVAYVGDYVEVEISNGTYDKNGAVNGAVVYNSGLSVLIAGGIFNQNNATDGGVVYSVVNISIGSAEFTSNTASNNGGAIFANGTGENAVDITGATFTGNSAGVSGGAIGIGQTATNTTLTISDSAFTNNSVSGVGVNITVEEVSVMLVGGGAIANSSSAAATITNSAFTQNSVTMLSADSVNEDIDYIALGGAFASVAPTTITGSAFVQNQVSGGSDYMYGNGGAIYVQGLLDITNSEFKENIASSIGGAICSAESLNITGSEFIENSVTSESASGGAIYQLSGTETIIKDTLFDANSSDNSNSAFYLLADTMFVENCVIKNHTTGDDYKKVLRFAGNGSVTFKDCQVFNNEGELAFWAGEQHIEGCEFTNSAEFYIGVDSNNTLYVDDCLFENNVGASLIVVVGSASLDISNSTIKNNTINSSREGLIYCVEIGGVPRTFTLTNTTFDNNGSLYGNYADIAIGGYGGYDQDNLSTYITLGSALASPISVYKMGATSFDDGDEASSYIAYSENADYLVDALDKITVINLPQDAILSADKKQNYIVIASDLFGLFDVTTGKQIYTWGQLTRDGFVTLKDSTLVMFDKSLAGRLLIKDEITTIGTGAFVDSLCSEIVIPDSVTTIQDDAFETSNSVVGSRLTTLKIGSGITSIGRLCFNNILENLYIADLKAWCEAEKSYNNDYIYLYVNNLYINNSLATTLTIPDGTTQIVGEAFRGLGNITSVNIPASVTQIDAGAFRCMTSLTGFVVSDSNANFVADNNVLFNKNKTILVAYPAAKGPTYSLPNATTTIANYAFSYAQNMESITLNNGLTSIGYGAFECLDSRADAGIDVSIPNTVTNLGERAFYISQVANVTLGTGITQIADETFYLSLLSSINLNNVSYIGDRAFMYAVALAGDLTIGANCTTIGVSAFKNCANIDSITFMGDVGTIKANAFSGCSSITSYNFTACTSVPSLENVNAFNNINDECTIVVPGKLYNEWISATNWSQYADYIVAYYNSGLFDATTDELIYSWQELLDLGKITVTSGELKGVDNTMAGKLVIDESVTAIGNSAFYGYTGLTAIDLPESITTIGRYAFHGTKIASMHIPKTVNTIYGNIFGACRDLTFVSVDEQNSVYYAEGNCIIEESTKTIVAGCGVSTIPTDIINIGDYAFYHCVTLASVTLPNSLVNIGASAFAYCSNLNNINIPSSVTTIEDSAFEGCGSLNAVYITDLAAWCSINFGSSQSNPLLHVGNLYLNNSLVENLSIPNTITRVNSFAFYGADCIKNLTIPATITSLGSLVFAACSNIESIVVDSGNTTYYSQNNCLIETSSKTLILGCKNSIMPSDVTAIGYGAFYGCTGLTSITIPNSVTSIGAMAFYACTGLTSITIPNSVTSIAGHAFSGCNNIMEYDFSEHSVIPTLGEDAFSVNNENYKIYVPVSLYNSWIAAENWESYKGHITTKKYNILFSEVNLSSSYNQFVIGDGLTAKTVTIGDYTTTYYQATYGQQFVVNKPSRPGFTFNGWKVYEVIGETETIIYEVNFGTTFTNLTTTIDGTIVFEALWLASYYEVIININGGGNIVAYINGVSHGATSAPIYVRSGSSKMYIPYNRAIVPSYYDPITGYTYNSLGESSYVPSVILHAERADYEFLGLFTAASGGEQIATRSGLLANTIYTDSNGWWDSTSASVTLYAQWESTVVIETTTINYEIYRQTVADKKVGTIYLDYGGNTAVGCSSGTESGSFELKDNNRVIVSVELCASYFRDEIRWDSDMFDTNYAYGVFVEIYDNYNDFVVTRAVINFASSGVYTIDITDDLFDGYSLYIYPVETRNRKDGNVISPILAQLDGSGVGARPSINSNMLEGKPTASLMGGAMFAAADASTSGLFDASGAQTYTWDELISAGMISEESGVIKKANSSIAGKLVLPDGLAVIDSYTFYGCSGLTEIVIPSTITIVGEYAFANCSGLETIIVNGANSVYKSVDNCLIEIATNKLIAGCKNSVIPSGVTAIGTAAFYGCSGLQTINIPEGVTTIGYYAFYDCSALTSITLPSTVTSIGQWAFMRCFNLTEVVGGTELSSIGVGAFAYCNNVVGYDFSASNNVISLATSVFIDINSNVQIFVSSDLYDSWIISQNWEDVKDYIYRKRVSENLDAGLYNSETGEMLYSWEELVSNGMITLSETTITDADTAMEGKLVISAEITAIGASAFYGCSKLTAVTIPETVTSIGNSAFYNCNQVLNYYFRSHTAIPTLGSSAFSSINEGCKIWVPGELMFDWMGASNWISYSNYIYSEDIAETNGGIYLLMDNTVMEHMRWNALIGDGSIIVDGAIFKGFNEDMKLEANAGASSMIQYGITIVFVIPETITEIGVGACAICDFISIIYVPSSIQSIGEGAFSLCANLTEVIIADGINNFVFEDGVLIDINNAGILWASPLISGQYVVPSGIEAIGAGAFGYCTALTSVTIPASVEYIGYGAFAYCTMVTSYDFKNHTNIPLLGESAFLNINSSALIYVPANLYDSWTVADNWSDWKLYIFAEGMEYAPGLYSNVTGKLIYSWLQLISNNMITISGTTITGADEDALQGMLIMSDDITAIGASAFENCYGISSITLSTNLASIGDSAFMGCSYIARMLLPASVQSIGLGAFTKCESMAVLMVDESNSTYATVDNVLFNKNKTALLAYANGKAGSYTIPNSVTTINHSAFAYAINLTYITIPNSVTTIGSYAFYACSGLSEITIPSSVTYIADYAFAECSNIKEYYFDTHTAVPTIESNTFGWLVFALESMGTDSAEAGLLASLYFIYVPAVLYDAWIAAENWYDIAIFIITERLEIDTSVAGVYDYLTGVMIAPWEYLLDEGMVEVSGSTLSAIAQIEPEEDETGKLRGFYLVLPEGITSIDQQVGAQCTGLFGIHLPSTLRSIGMLALAYTMVAEFNIPAACTNIGTYALAASLVCTSINVDPTNRSYVSENGVLFNKTKSRLIMYPCGKGGVYSIPQSVVEIADMAFLMTTMLTSVVIPSSVSSIGARAFYSSGISGRLVIPNNVTKIEENAFTSCSSLTSVVMGNNVSSIGERAFADCSNLVTITIPNALTTLGKEAFDGCSSLTGTLNIPNVKVIPERAFTGLSNITQVVISSQLQSIGRFAFEGCSSLTGTLTIPDTCSSVAECAFRRTGFSSAIIGSASLGNNAFQGSTALTSVTFTSNVRNIGEFAFEGCTNLTGNITIPNNCTFIGQAAFRTTGITSLELGTGITSISNYTFQDNKSLKSVVFNGNVTTIGLSAFAGCSALAGTLTLPASLVTISNYAFQECSSISALSMGNNVTTIGDLAFYNCSNITGTLTLSNKLTKIGQSAFRGCSKISGTLVIPSTCTSLGNQAFQGCSALTGLNLGTGLTTIGDLAFYGCTNLAGSLTLPSSLISIGKSAFRDNKKLTGTLTIGNSVETIDNQAFQNCTGFTGLVIGTNVKYINELAFYNCTGLTSLTLNSTKLISIGTSALRALTKITGTITFPNTLTTIGDFAFHSATGITRFTFGTSLTSLGAGAFANCTSVTTYDFTAATKVPTLSNPNCFNGIVSGVWIVVPSGLYSSWIAATNWSTRSEFIKSSTATTASISFDTSAVTLASLSLSDEAPVVAYVKKEDDDGEDIDIILNKNEYDEDTLPTINKTTSV